MSFFTSFYQFLLPNTTNFALFTVYKTVKHRFSRTKIKAIYTTANGNNVMSTLDRPQARENAGDQSTISLNLYLIGRQGHMSFFQNQSQS